MGTPEENELGTLLKAGNGGRRRKSKPVFLRRREEGETDKHTDRISATPWAPCKGLFPYFLISSILLQLSDKFCAIWLVETRRRLTMELRLDQTSKFLTFDRLN